MKIIYETPKPWSVASIIWQIFGGEYVRRSDTVVLWEKDETCFLFKKEGYKHFSPVTIRFSKTDLETKEELCSDFESRIMELQFTLENTRCECTRTDITGGIKLEFLEEKVGLFLILIILDDRSSLS